MADRRLKSLVIFSAFGYLVQSTTFSDMQNQVILTSNDILQLETSDRTVAFNDPKPPVLLHVTLYQSISLVCEAASINGPAPRVFWVKKGKPLLNTAHSDSDEIQPSGMQNVITSTTRSILYLDCISAVDAGLYTCVAENKFAKVTTATSLVVLTGQPYNIRTVMLKKQCTHKPTAAQPPRVVMWSKNMLQTQGLDVKLFCRAVGTPKPKITWELQQERSPATMGELQIWPILLTDSKHKLLPNGDLIVEKLEFRKDMGNYVCRAQNSMGVDHAEAFVYPVRQSTQ